MPVGGDSVRCRAAALVPYLLSVGSRSDFVAVIDRLKSTEPAGPEVTVANFVSHPTTLFMGTRGFKVYRHKGRYYVYYNHRDSYPHGLGLEVLDEIPRDVSKEVFEKWVRDTREDVYAERDSPELNDPDDSSNFVSDKQPDNDFLIHWIYEIDLDNLVFHVDSQPLFRLDNMPPDNIFLKSISFDQFGHRALHEDTPAQYRYDWRAPPPSPHPESLAAYNSCHIRSSTSSVHDLLDVPVALSSIERVRMALVKLLVKRCMVESGVGHDVRVLENVPDRDHIPQSMLQLALSLVNFAVEPPIPSLPCIPYGNNCDFVWIRKDVFLRITTHLDDEDNLKSSIGDLVRHINITSDKVGTVYGIVCSIFHCAIVRVDKDDSGRSFAHTPALQLLPSFYARTMFTPGIEALSRLGCLASGVDSNSSITSLRRTISHVSNIRGWPLPRWRQKWQSNFGRGLEALLDRRPTRLHLPLFRHRQCQLRPTSPAIPWSGSFVWSMLLPVVQLYQFRRLLVRRIQWKQLFL